MPYMTLFQTSDVPAPAWGQKPGLGYWKAKAIGLGPGFVPQKNDLNLLQETIFLPFSQ